mgnify:CR=1 FL=1
MQCQSQKYPAVVWLCLKVICEVRGTALNCYMYLCEGIALTHFESLNEI